MIKSETTDEATRHDLARGVARSPVERKLVIASVIIFALVALGLVLVRRHPVAADPAVSVYQLPMPGHDLVAVRRKE